MTLSVARTLPRVARVSRSQLRRYATPAVERPPGYIPTGEEFIAQRAAIKEHAKGVVGFGQFVVAVLGVLTVLGFVETTDLWRKIRSAACTIR